MAADSTWPHKAVVLASAPPDTGAADLWRRRGEGRNVASLSAGAAVASKTINGEKMLTDAPVPCPLPDANEFSHSLIKDEHIEVRLLQKYSLNCIRIMLYNDGRPYYLSVEVFDGQHWTVIRNNQALMGGWSEITFEEQTVSAIRLYGGSNSGPSPLLIIVKLQAFYQWD